MRLYVPNRTLDTNEAGLSLIRKAEKFEPRWYRCYANVLTIGYGLTKATADHLGLKINPPITVEQAEEYLRLSIATIYEPAVEKVRVPMTENQFAALSSFVYNVGVGAFLDSTLFKLLNDGDYDGAADQFQYWVYSGGKVLNGLVKRREAEKQLFLSKPVTKVEPMHRVDVQPLPVKPPQMIPVDNTPRLRVRGRKAA